MHVRVSIVFSLLVGGSACASTPPTSAAAGTAAEASETDGAVCGAEAPTGVQVGMCAPEFSLPDRDEVSVSLHAQRGKVVLVDLSAIW